MDEQLDAKLREAAPGQREELARLRGAAAIANAKIAYQRFREAFAASRFARLRARGARVQRPLWASTSTKNPAYRDVRYVEALIGPETVNTMPQQTLDAFRSHGVVARTVDRDVGEAHEVLAGLRRVGIDLDAVTAELLEKGIEAFDDSLRELRSDIEQKLEALRTDSPTLTR